MTVETTTSTVVYQGNDVAVEFDFPFKTLDETHLSVTRRDTATGLVDYTYTDSDFTITGIGDAEGGTVELNDPLASGYEIVIERTVPYTQALDIVNQSGFYPQSIEDQLDLIEMQVQQIAALAGRSITVAVGEELDSLPSATARANMFLSFDANGLPVLSSGTGSDSAFRTDVAAADGSSLVGFIQSGAGALLRSTEGKLREFVSALDYIPVALHAAILAHTSAVDVTAYVQTAIDECDGGADILFPNGRYVIGDLILKSGITLLGTIGGGYGYLASDPTTKTVFQMAVGSTWCVDTPATAVALCFVEGIDFSGLGAGTANGGIRFRDVTWGGVKRCYFNNFGEQGILYQDGPACTFEDILMTNVLLNRARAAKTGALEISSINATDFFINRVECNPGLTAKTDANLYCCAILIAGWNGMISNAVGEFGDVGICITGSLNRISNSRADLNAGHGWEISGSNSFSTSLGLSNSQDATNTYDNWRMTAGNSNFSACVSSTTTPKVPKYGFNDTQQSDSNKNYYDATCRSTGAGTANWFIDFAGGARMVPKGPPKSWASLDTTPSVDGYGTFVTANAGATSITTFDDGINGQEITVICADANTTLVQGATLTLLNGASRKLVNGSVTRFVKQNTVWREVGPRPLRATAAGVDPGSLATGASTAVATIAVAGAALGNIVEASFSIDLAGVALIAWVSAADVVSYVFVNLGGANPTDLGAGIVTVHVRPQ